MQIVLRTQPGANTLMSLTVPVPKQACLGKNKSSIYRPDVLAASGQQLMAVLKLKLQVVLSSNKVSEPRCDCLLTGTAGGAHLNDMELQVGQPQVGAPGGHEPLQQLVVHAPHGAHICQPRIRLPAGATTAHRSGCH